MKDKQQRFFEALIAAKSEYKALSKQQYEEIHSTFLIPTDFKININLFDQQIIEYSDRKVRWGPEHHNFPRFGLPLVNLDGKVGDPNDPSCAPLDTVWDHTGEMYWDHDFTVPTEILDLSCFDPINPIKPHMIRSNILWWDTMGHFKPHVDNSSEYCTNIRLWGTNKQSYHMTFEGQKVKNFEPGRLYIMDTAKVHEARADEEFTCTFFLSFKLEVLDVKGIRR